MHWVLMFTLQYWIVNATTTLEPRGMIWQQSLDDRVFNAHSIALRRLHRGRR